MPAFIHLDVCVAAFHRIELGCHAARRAGADVPIIEVVRRANEDGAVALRGVLGPVNICGHTLAIAHTDHHLAVDNRNRLELRFDLVALFAKLR